MNGADPIVIGQAPGVRNLNDCGCCEGLTAQTPVELKNRPGLTAIAYRVGTHAKFKQSLLAQLSSSEQPALAGLKTREDNDFSIALLDAWATVADVLTFYQERIANESYHRTATKRRSLLEQARLIGYELRPGVAAGAYLAFTLEDAPGAPQQTTIDVGTKVQSVPGPDEKPQTFETVEKIEARVGWNTLKPQITQQQSLGIGTTRLFLKGVNTQLQPGDAIVFVDKEREGNSASTRWAFRMLQTVKTNPDKDHTEVIWKDGLQAALPSGQPVKEHVKIFALRQRAALFGHNAPAWRTMPLVVKQAYKANATDDPSTWGSEWPDFGLENNQIDLDVTYPKIVNGSWVILTKPNYVQLHKVVGVTSVSRAQFGLNAKITRLDPDRPLALLPLRTTTVFAQSEQLELSEELLAEPVYGHKITLSQLAPDLKPGQALAISGKRVRVRIAETAQGLKLISPDGTERNLKPGDSLLMMEPPVFISAGGIKTKALSPGRLIIILASSTPQQLKWHLMDQDGFVGFVTAPSDKTTLQEATKEDPMTSEVAFISNSSNAVFSDRKRTTITLRDPLQNCYDRETVTINANVARATHGESVQEVLGSGDASQAYQQFTLRQPPLTYISATTPSGAETTLQVRVNDLLLKEVPSLYGRGPNEHVFITRTDDEGKTTVQFGDGVAGARLPTGQENVRAAYRKGIGLDGNVKAGQLTTLMTRPLGVKGVTNPLQATGADDRESLDDARQNAPLTVLTMERTVSLRDYEDFARSFAGIAKALATWIWDGRKRGVFITVAGPKGAEVKSDSDLYKNLLNVLRKAGDPYVNIRVKSYRKALFRVKGKIKVASEFQQEKVMAAVNQALRTHFSFEARAFGQPVMLSEVIAVMQAVPGVTAVDLDKLYRADGTETLNPRIIAEMPAAGSEDDVEAAELLTLDPAPIELGVMP
jgi:hypothetical protein